MSSTTAGEERGRRRGATRTFLDTNIVVYAVDGNEPAKQQVALEAIASLAPGSGVLSTQVLTEFYVTATRKLAIPLSHDDAAFAVERLARFDVVSHDARLVRAAIGLCASTRISLWDALIVRAAATSGCERLLTEDLNAGQRIDGVLVENPFAS